MHKEMPLPATLLVVDDEEGMRTTLADILEGQFSRIDQAANGEEAVRKAREVAYDLILMDVRMPVLDGLQALRRMRQEASHLRVVLMTAYDDRQDLANVREEVLAILPKPLDLKALLALVHDVLDEKAQPCAEQGRRGVGL